MTQKQLEALQAKWYKKLAKSGFVDIESPLKQHVPLKHWDSIKFQSQYSPEAYIEKERYYQLAGQLLYSHNFKCPRDRRVWAMHVEGRDYKDIASKVGVHPLTVRNIVRRYAVFIRGGGG